MYIYLYMYVYIIDLKILMTYLIIITSYFNNDLCVEVYKEYWNSEYIPNNQKNRLISLTSSLSNWLNRYQRLDQSKKKKKEICFPHTTTKKKKKKCLSQTRFDQFKLNPKVDYTLKPESQVPSAGRDRSQHLRVTKVPRISPDQIGWKLNSWLGGKLINQLVKQ